MMAESRAAKPPLTSLPEMLLWPVAKAVTVMLCVPAGVLGPVVMPIAVGSLTRELMTLKSLWSFRAAKAVCNSPMTNLMAETPEILLSVLLILSSIADFLGTFSASTKL